MINSESQSTEIFRSIYEEWYENKKFRNRVGKKLKLNEKKSKFSHLLKTPYS